MFVRTALVLALTLTAESSTQREAAAHKQPWEWSLEERIAARTDPAARRQRVAAYEQRREKGAVGTTTAERIPQRPTTDDLNGQHHPELFLPTEVGKMFIAVAYAFDDELARDTRESATRAATIIGLSADFVEVFQREAAITARLQAEEIAAADRASTAGTDAAGAWEQVLQLRAQQCPVRAAAMERLRTMYGPLFDRFLYEYAAKHMSWSYNSEPPTPDELRRVEGGCR